MKQHQLDTTDTPMIDAGPDSAESTTTSLPYHQTEEGDGQVPQQVVKRLSFGGGVTPATAASSSVKHDEDEGSLPDSLRCQQDEATSEKADAVSENDHGITQTVDELVREIWEAGENVEVEPQEWSEDMPDGRLFMQVEPGMQVALPERQVDATPVKMHWQDNAPAGGELERTQWVFRPEPPVPDNFTDETHWNKKVELHSDVDTDTFHQGMLEMNESLKLGQRMDAQDKARKMLRDPGLGGFHLNELIAFSSYFMGALRNKQLSRQGRFQGHHFRAARATEEHALPAGQRERLERMHLGHLLPPCPFADVDVDAWGCHMVEELASMDRFLDDEG